MGLVYDFTQVIKRMINVFESHIALGIPGNNCVTDFRTYFACTTIKTFVAQVEQLF